MRRLALILIIIGSVFILSPSLPIIMFMVSDQDVMPTVIYDDYEPVEPTKQFLQDFYGFLLNSLLSILPFIGITLLIVGVGIWYVDRKRSKTTDS